MHDDPAQAPSLGTRGKEPVIELTCVLDPSGSSSGDLPRDDLEWRLTQVDLPPQVDDVCLVPFSSHID